MRWRHAVVLDARYTSPVWQKPTASRGWQRDKLRFTRYAGKPAVSPVGFCALDALWRARHEIPPDMARTVQRRAAQHGNPAGMHSAQPGGSAFFEQQQGSFAE